MATITNNPAPGARPPGSEPTVRPPGSDAGGEGVRVLARGVAGAALGNLGTGSELLAIRARSLAQLAGTLNQPPTLPPPSVHVGGISAEQVLDEARRNRDKGREVSIGGTSAQLGLNLEPFKEAGAKYSADVAQGLKGWVTANPSRAINFGVQIFAAAAAAVASGGTSLVVDGPKLAAAGLAIASDVLRASGVSLDKVVGDTLSASLQALGVDKAVAGKWGATLAASTGAALELTLFLTSNGQHKMDAARFGAFASNLAEAVGVDRANAALVAATVTGLATIGITVANGGQLALAASANALFGAATGLGAQLMQGLSEGQVDLAGLLTEGAAVHGKFKTLLTDIAKDAGAADFLNNAGALVGQLAQAALATLVGWTEGHAQVQA